MPPRPRSTPSGSDDVKPLELCRDDRRKFYGVLDGDLPARMRRLEIAVYGLLATTVLRLASGFPVEQIPAALYRLIF